MYLSDKPTHMNKKKSTLMVWISIQFQKRHKHFLMIFFLKFSSLRSVAWENDFWVHNNTITTFSFLHMSERIWLKFPIYEHCDTKSCTSLISFNQDQVTSFPTRVKGWFKPKYWQLIRWMRHSQPINES